MASSGMTSSSTSAPTLKYPFSDLMFSPFRHRFPSMGLSLREEANRLAGQGVRPLHGNAVVPRVHYRHGLVALSAYLEGASIDKGQAAIEHHDGVTANDRAFHDFHGPAPLALPRCHSTLLSPSGRCVPPGGRRPPAEAHRLRGRTGSDILYSRRAPRRPALTCRAQVQKTPHSITRSSELAQCGANFTELVRAGSSKS